MTLTRSKPIQRKRATKRRTTTPRCTKQRCTKRAEIEGLCISHAEAEADARFSWFVRSRDSFRCTARGMFDLACAGNLQAAHIVGRRKMPTRFHESNVHALCQAHHRLVDQHGAEAAKYRWAVSRIGVDGWELITTLALGTLSRRDATSQALARYTPVPDKEDR